MSLPLPSPGAATPAGIARSLTSGKVRGPGGCHRRISVKAIGRIPRDLADRRYTGVQSRIPGGGRDCRSPAHRRHVLASLETLGVHRHWTDDEVWGVSDRPASTEPPGSSMISRAIAHTRSRLRWPASELASGSSTRARRAPLRPGTPGVGQPRAGAARRSARRGRRRLHQLHAAAVGLRDRAHDREAEAARAAAVARAADEALEDPVAQLGRDARAVVLDDEHDLAVAALHGRLDRRARVRVA